MMNDQHPQINFDQITENIWVGNNMCCMVHSHELHSLGFDADIDMEDMRQEEPPRTKVYLWLPTADTTAPSQEQLRTGVAAITEMVRQRMKIYIHCRFGAGRGPTMAASYLISTGMNVDEALTLLKSKRPAVDLSETQLLALYTFKSSL